MRAWLGSAVVGMLVATALVSGIAAADEGSGGARNIVLFDDPYDLPEAPRPPTLPELTHPEVEGTLEETMGSITPNQPTAHNVAVMVQRLAVEYPLGARRWFAGAGYELAGGEPPGGGTPKAVGGNLDVYGRTVWATRTGLAFGGGLGVTFPLASFGRDGDGQRVANAAAMLRPWDLPFFQEGFFALRPFFDVRDVDGPFVIQFREGIDWSFDTRDLPVFRVAAVSALYIGYRFPLIGAGIEGFEYYFLDYPTAETERAVVVVSPSVRFMTPYVQPAVSFLSNLGTPLFGISDHFWGLRLAATVVWEPYVREP